MVSAFFVPPNLGYLSYIDWDTLALLFSLMAVMKGFQQEGLFRICGQRSAAAHGHHSAADGRAGGLALLLQHGHHQRRIFNHLRPLRHCGAAPGAAGNFVVPLIAMQTLAANLGSMLTPMGNPQNLYLYSRSGMGFLELCGVLLPYVVFSGICLLGMVALRRPQPVPRLQVKASLGSGKNLAWCTGGLLLCLLGIFNLVPSLAIAGIVLVVLLFRARKLLAAVDYSLLGTFAAFFVFIGNLSAIPSFQQFLMGALEGHVVPVSVLASQVISNVPAALLLSGFTQDWEGLLIGTNLGGLGTLIASMASLISYKQLSREYPTQRGTYFRWFTVSNVALLALLLLEYGLLGNLSL